jgi:GAF domain-containing protein
MNNSLEPRQPSSRGGHDVTERQLLQSIVEVARSVFGAAAASVLLFDGASGELVFEALSGNGEESLIGTRFDGKQGIAGWVAACGEPMLIDDVSDNPHFAQEFAASTGYVPRSIMAAPLIRQGQCVGVLEVLDRGSQPRGELDDVGLLGMLATELAISVELLVRLRSLTADSDSASRTAAGETDASVLSRAAERLPAAQGPIAVAVQRLLTAADDLLTAAAATRTPPGD